MAALVVPRDQPHRTSTKFINILIYGPINSLILSACASVVDVLCECAPSSPSAGSGKPGFYLSATLVLLGAVSLSLIDLHKGRLRRRKKRALVHSRSIQVNTVIFYPYRSIQSCHIYTMFLLECSDESSFCPCLMRHLFILSFICCLFSSVCIYC